MSERNENVKIWIQENDLTNAASRAATTSDIAFVPGFLGKKGVDKGNYKTGVPKLCTSLEEFEEHFGTSPVTVIMPDKTKKLDTGYIFARELIRQGMYVVYVAVADGGEPSYNDQFKNSFKSILNDIKDRNEYSVKYVTSGGYPAFDINVTANLDDGKTSITATDVFATAMIEACESRGDAVALVDFPETEERTVDEVYAALNNFATEKLTKEQQTFGTTMYPWVKYNTSFTELNEAVSMPASFAYLMCVAKAIKTSPNWLAMAGVTRGLVTNVERLITKGVLTNTVAEDCQPKFGTDGNNVSMNCITNIRPYGLCIWGNRTLLALEKDKGTVALNFLNTRNMISDIKKVLYTTAKSLMFEQNSDTLWLRFKSGVSPLLNQLKSGNGISDYKIIKTNKRYDGNQLTKGEMAAVIRVYPMYAVEYFELTVEISDEDVKVD